MINVTKREALLLEEQAEPSLTSNFYRTSKSRRERSKQERHTKRAEVPR